MPVGSNTNHDLSRRDPCRPARLAGEGALTHVQATPQMAADRGWYYRRDRTQSLEPDTRRCINCGEHVFPAMTLTESERTIRHPLSTAVLLGEGF